MFQLEYIRLDKRCYFCISIDGQYMWLTINCAHRDLEKVHEDKNQKRGKWKKKTMLFTCNIHFFQQMSWVNLKYLHKIFLYMNVCN